MKTIIQNFKEVFSNWKYLVFSIISFLVFFSIFQYFTDTYLIEVNLGLRYLYLTLILQFLIALLLALFISISIYKFNYFRKFSAKEQSSSVIGGILGFLVAGCPSCSITFASYIGLGSFVAFLPYYGMELKFVSIVLLFYSNISVLYSLKTCIIKEK
jgi:hypothetical protein